jgi:hypothetical protein
MGTAEKIALAIVGVGFVTTLILPDRITVQVIRAGSDFFTRSLGQAMGFKPAYGTG